jgi:hypothetical protein
MRWSAALGVFGAFALAACTSATPAEPDAPPSAPRCVASAPVAATPSPRRVRRLTDQELDAVMSDLVGEPVTPSKGLIADPRVDGYEGDALALVVSGPKLDGYVAALEPIATKLAETAACEPASAARACAERFVRNVAPRAFGRPVTEDEIARLLTTTDLRIIARAILLAPSTLYRTEIGAVANPTERDAKLDDWEIASELSFLVTGRRPDEALRAAAARHELANDPRNVRLHAERLLKRPDARLRMQRFVRGWLQLDKLSTLQRNKSFGSFGKEERAAMSAEVDRFVEHVVFDGTGTFDELLTSSVTYPDDVLAPIYGADLLEPTHAGAAVHLDPRSRKGILSLPGFLTVHSTADRTNPVDRGVFVRVRLLCQELGAPPRAALAVPVAPTSDVSTTTREKFALHSKGGICQGCHELIDPVGFGFEGFDAIGRRRTTENGFPVDDSGFMSADVQGSFRGPAELGGLLVKSRDAQACFVAQLYRFAEGRREDDLCELEPLVAKFLDHDRSIPELLLAYVTRPEFFVRRGER